MKSDRRVRSTREHTAAQRWVPIKFREALTEGSSALADLLVVRDGERVVSDAMEPVTVHAWATGVKAPEDAEGYAIYFVDMDRYELPFEIC